MRKSFKFSLTLEELVDVFNGLDSYLEDLQAEIMDPRHDQSRELTSAHRRRVSALYQRLMTQHTST